jgi:hypothetical protein
MKRMPRGIRPGACLRPSAFHPQFSEVIEFQRPGLLTSLMLIERHGFPVQTVLDIGSAECSFLPLRWQAELYLSRRHFRSPALPLPRNGHLAKAEGKRLWLQGHHRDWYAVERMCNARGAQPLDVRVGVPAY